MFGIAMVSGLLAAQSRQTVRTPVAQSARTRWFRDAGFGLYITWGLSSIPAGVWKGQSIAGEGERIMRTARIPLREYEGLAKQFNPKEFDAEKWAQFAEDAGAKYIVVEAKGPDGFAMYRSAVSKYNVYDATPFHRDPLRELAMACAKHGLRLGIAYSDREDWASPDAPGNDWDFGPDAQKNFDLYLHSKAEPQVRELLTGYGPVGMFRFDSVAENQTPAPPSLLSLVRRLRPGALIEGAAIPPGDYMALASDRMPTKVQPGAWVVRTTMNRTWGFKAEDNNWLSTDELIFNLVDAVSKGGGYAVNVGPTAEGIIPRPSLPELADMGEWLDDNGDAIYGAGPTPFGEELAGRLWRCTTRPGKLYITLFRWPDGPFELDHVKGLVTKAYLMTDEDETEWKVTQNGQHVTVALPKDPPIEGEVPERMNPVMFQNGQRAHLHRVLVLETKNAR
ncbi:MAG: alpha-L-fucosidase [Acidobacteriota bacterium]|nr:alpha-L-fucosidase [Acidobacteriota bacterium]